MCIDIFCKVCMMNSFIWFVIIIMINDKYVFLISCLCVREEIMVVIEEGFLYRIKWNVFVN